jgi:TRAP-type C4-dicarboxylate transport system substrate-binding protein
MTMLRAMGALALLVFASAAHAGDANPKVQLKIATLAPEGSTWMNLMRELDARVREATGNEVGFKFYAGGVQGDERLVLRKMRSGQLHGGGFTGNGLGAIAPSLRVLEVPFLLETEAEIDAMYARFGPELEKALNDAGYVLLGWAEVGFIHLFTKKPVATLADLRDQKMWLWEGDPLPEALFEEARVAPVSLAITDVYTSLQTGLVDGVYSSPYGCVVLQWHTQVSAMSEVPITHAIGAVVVSKPAFEKASSGAQAKVREIAADVFARLKAASRLENRAAIADIKKAGIAIVPVAPKELETLRAIGARAAQRGVGTLYSQELLDRVRAAVEEVRRQQSATSMVGEAR